jgi:hypothetical protein
MGTLYYTSATAADIHRLGDFTQATALSSAILVLLLIALGILIAVSHLTEKYNRLVDGPLSRLKPPRARITIRVHARSD